MSAIMLDEAPTETCPKKCVGSIRLLSSLNDAGGLPMKLRLTLVILATAVGLYGLSFAPAQANQEDCTNWSTWAGDAIPVTDPRCAMSTSEPVTAKPASPNDAFAVLVEWQPVTSNAHRLEYYRVFTSPPTSGEDIWNDPEPACPQTTATGCIVRGLNAGQYEFWVQAVPLFGPVTVSGPSNTIALPLPGVKVSKYQQYASLANNVIAKWVDETNKFNAAGAAKTFTTPQALRVSSRIAKNVCKTFRWANRKGGISKSELEVVAEVVWVQHKATIDLLTGEGISPEQIDSAISAQALVIAAGVQTYCPKYSPVYVQRVMKINRKKFNEYMDLDG